MLVSVFTKCCHNISHPFSKAFYLEAMEAELAALLAEENSMDDSCHLLKSHNTKHAYIDYRYLHHLKLENNDFAAPSA